MAAMPHPNHDMLLRIAQADAYCMATEYVKSPCDDEHVAAVLRFERYMAHPTYHHTLKPGQYTDDTQMSLAVAEVLIDPNSNAHTKATYAKAFFECFKRDPRAGYSRNFQQILESSGTWEQLVQNLVPDSDKNGAAMRSVPIGVYREPYMVKQVAQVQAKVTHDTPDGIASSQAVALMSHMVLWTDHPLSYAPDFLRLYGLDECALSLTGRVEGPRVGMQTAQAVCTLVSSEPDLMSILRRTIERGGDTDSVASIAWGIASTRMREQVPDFLETGLEPGGRFGVGFLKDLGKRLMDAHA